jgi:CBS domain-containing protein
MKVRDAMAKTISSARPDSTVQEVAEIMKKEDSGFVPVVEGERLVGVVTDRDIVIRCLAEGHRSPLEEAIDHIMSRNVRTIDPESDISKAAEMMKGEEIRRLAVCEGDRLVGVLSHGNLVQAMEGEGPAKDATKGVTRGA